MKFSWSAPIAMAFVMSAVYAQAAPSPSPEPVPGPGNVFAATYGPLIQLLEDPNFANGFRADASCGSYSGHNILRLGTCTSYKPLYVNSFPFDPHYTVHTWPDPGAPNDANKYWHLTEGEHSGFTKFGYTFPLGSDLAVHRFEANQRNGSQVSFGNNNEIFLMSSNNLFPEDPHPGGLVRSLYSDKTGPLKMYMNTLNEIENSAIDNQNGNNTWPHYIVEQRFRQFLDIATFYSLTLDINISIEMAEQWLNWMRPVGSGGFSEATFGVGITLRQKINPYVTAFLNYRPYSVWKNSDGSFSNPPPPQVEDFGVEQNGIINYRGNVADIGGPMARNESRSIVIDLDTLFNRAVAKAIDQGPPPGLSYGVWHDFVTSTLDDYYLTAVGAGWETMGYEEVQSTISGFRLFGQPSVLLDAEVYQDEYYRQANPDIGAWRNGGTRRAHWVEEGLAAGRVASPTFDVKIYVARNASTMSQCFQGSTPDYMCAAAHYVYFGRPAGLLGRYDTPDGFGLRATYYNNTDFTGPTAVRTDSAVNFDWQAGPPDDGIAPDSFSVRWEGKVAPRYTQTYVFSTLADDGVRLYVDGQLIINDWTQHGATLRESQPILLKAGKRCDIKLEYFDESGGASVKLRWQSASQALEVIPQSRLYPAPYY